MEMAVTAIRHAEGPHPELRPSRRRHARNALQVGCELPAFESTRSEQALDRLRLSESDLEGKETAGNQRAIRRGDQAAIHVEPILAGKQGERGLVIANLDGNPGRSVTGT